MSAEEAEESPREDVGQGHAITVPMVDSWALNRPLQATCSCGWRSRPMSVRRATTAGQDHLVQFGAGPVGE